MTTNPNKNTASTALKQEYLMANNRSYWKNTSKAKDRKITETQRKVQAERFNK